MAYFAYLSLIFSHQQKENNTFHNIVMNIYYE
jgi:hypothetical protein